MSQLHELVVLAQSGGLTLDFVERHRQVLYPALAVLVFVLLGASIISAWRSPKVAGVERARLKGEVIRAMRQNIGWITAGELAEILETDPHAMSKLLEEMKEDGVLVSALLQNLIHFRLKGV